MLTADLGDARSGAAVPPAPGPVDFTLPVLLAVFVVAAVTATCVAAGETRRAAHEEVPVATAEWVFRHAGNCLIEVPPLELPPPPDRADADCVGGDAVARRHVANGWPRCRGSKPIGAGRSPDISPSATCSSSVWPPSAPRRRHRRCPVGSSAGTGG